MVLTDLGAVFFGYGYFSLAREGRAAEVLSVREADALAVTGGANTVLDITACNVPQRILHQRRARRHLCATTISAAAKAAASAEDRPASGRIHRGAAHAEQVVAGCARTLPLAVADASDPRWRCAVRRRRGERVLRDWVWINACLLYTSPSPRDS